MDAMHAIDSRSVEQCSILKMTLDVGYCQVFYWDIRFLTNITLLVCNRIELVLVVFKKPGMQRPDEYII